MAEKNFEPEDPLALNGVVVPLGAGEAAEANAAMAECFIEEYLLLGYGELEILYLFKTPFYRAPHGVYKERGEGFVRDLIRKVTQGESHA